MFAFRYLEIAEMITRKDKTIEKHYQVRKCSRKINYLGISLILINYLVYFGNTGILLRATGGPDDGHYSQAIQTWTYFYMPSIFTGIFALILFVALLLIYSVLRRDKEVKGNEKWMCIHFFLVIILTGSLVYTSISKTAVTFKIASACDCIVYLMMAYILNQTNYHF